MSVEDAVAAGIEVKQREEDILKRRGLYDLASGATKVKDAGGAKGYQD